MTFLEVVQYLFPSVPRPELHLVAFGADGCIDINQIVRNLGDSNVSATEAKNLSKRYARELDHTVNHIQIGSKDFDLTNKQGMCTWNLFSQSGSKMIDSSGYAVSVGNFARRTLKEYQTTDEVMVYVEAMMSVYSNDIKKVQEVFNHKGRVIWAAHFYCNGCTNFLGVAKRLRRSLDFCEIDEQVYSYLNAAEEYLGKSKILLAVCNDQGETQIDTALDKCKELKTAIEKVKPILAKKKIRYSKEKEEISARELREYKRRDWWSKIASGFMTLVVGGLILWGSLTLLSEEDRSKIFGTTTKTESSSPVGEYLRVVNNSLVGGRLKAYAKTGESPRKGYIYISYKVGRNGRISSVTLEEKSGHHQLDKDAVARVKRASPLPPPPDELKPFPTKLGFSIPFEIK